MFLAITEGCSRQIQLHSPLESNQADFRRNRDNGRNKYCKKNQDNIQNNVISYDLVGFYVFLSILGFRLAFLRKSVNPRVDKDKNLLETWGKVLVTSRCTDDVQKKQ